MNAFLTAVGVSLSHLFLHVASLRLVRCRVLPSLGAVLLAGVLACADDPQAINSDAPKTIEAKTGKLLKVGSSLKSMDITWELIDAGRAEFVPADDLKASTYCWLVPAGNFRLHAIGVVDGKIVIERFSVHTDKNPGPEPPEPPGPNPKPPANTLAAKFQEAYDADPATPSVKAFQRTSLIGLYQAVAEVLPARADIKTADQLRVLLKETSDKLVAPSGLLGLRKIIGGEIASAIGVDPVELTPALRAKAVQTFESVAKALSEVK
jgi:hypothetical protein